MGLYKEIEKQNGVITNYHRIVSMNIITNIQNLIEVASYTSKAKREEEAIAIQEGNEHNVYIDTLYIAAPYEQNMTIESAYGWLKKQEMFKDAVDDLQ